MDSQTRAAFTLIELLVVIAIIAVLAGILFPVFQSAKSAAKKTACFSNERQLVLAMSLYLGDSSGTYPQSKDALADPSVEDRDGSLNEPDYGSTFNLILPYVKQAGVVRGDQLFICPAGTDAFGTRCLELNPDVPDLTSYVVNGSFIFGLNESSVSQPSNTILLAERRSEDAHDAAPYCDYAYYPWFNSANSETPEDDMDADFGAVASKRHSERSNFAFADAHVRSLNWTQTYSPPSVNLHSVNRP